MADESIPDYQRGLGAYHEAFAKELEAAVDALLIDRGARVLDVACGDGVYSAWLSRRVGPSGNVVALDVMPAYLELARRNVQKMAAETADRVEYALGDLLKSPMAPASFDLVWCAQSLRSLPPRDSLESMVELTRPGGRVAVLENDALHQVLLPWPEKLELAIRRAELAGLSDEEKPASRHYVGRRLPSLFRKCGLVDVRVTTRAADRQSPLKASEREFLECYLSDLRELVDGELDAAMRKELERLARPGSKDYLPDRDDFHFTCVDRLVIGTRPG